MTVLTCREYARSLRNKLAMSVLRTNVDDIRESRWTDTMCQDIHHSVYCTYCDVKSISYDMCMMYPGDVSDSSLELVQFLRSFLVEWHGSFFVNAEYNGKSYISKPKESMIFGVTSDYRSAFLDFQHKFVEFMNKECPYFWHDFDEHKENES